MKAIAIATMLSTIAVGLVWLGIASRRVPKSGLESTIAIYERASSYEDSFVLHKKHQTKILARGTTKFISPGILQIEYRPVGGGRPGQSMAESGFRFVIPAPGIGRSDEPVAATQIGSDPVTYTSVANSFVIKGYLSQGAAIVIAPLFLKKTRVYSLLLRGEWTSVQPNMPGTRRFVSFVNGDSEIVIDSHTGLVKQFESQGVVVDYNVVHLTER